jgi:thymidylate kinase
MAPVGSPSDVRRPLLISFSGLDGSGKSTHIQNLCSVLEARGYRTARLAFWDDVVVLTRYREGFVHKVFGSEPGIGSPGKPVKRRDKNMRSWYLTLARHALYLLDTLNLRRVLARARHSGADIIVMDRYIYDELANLPLANRLSRGFLRGMCRLAPQPDIAYLLDADPEAACARKPEYPLDFMRQCRGWYHALSNLLGTIIVIPPAPLAEAQRQVVQVALRYLQLAADEISTQLPSSPPQMQSGDVERKSA